MVSGISAWKVQDVINVPLIVMRILALLIVRIVLVEVIRRT